MINIKNGLLILCTKHKQTHRLNELTVAGGRVGGIVREFGMDRYTLLYLKCISNKDLLYGTESSCSMLWGNLDGRGVWGRMDTRVCMAESLCCPSETITTLSVGYTPI